MAGGAFLVGVGAALVGASTAMGDPSSTTAPPPPPPPPPSSTQTITATPPPSTRTQSKPPKDSTPPPPIANLKVNVHTPGQITLTWELVNASQVAHVFVKRGPAGQCPTFPLQRSARTIGSFDPRARAVDTTAKDGIRYCYSVFTLDNAGNWAKPGRHLARNPGDTKPPAAVGDVTVTPAGSQGVTLSWTNPKGVVEVAVIRATGASCAQKPVDGARIGDRQLRSSQTDASAKPGSTYCYSVFAFDAAGNRSKAATEPATVPAAPKPTTPAPPAEGGTPGSTLPDVVGLLGGGAIVFAGLAYVTLRLFRREWEWHSRTGYGIRDLMSIDVRGYDRPALVIPAVIGVCIAGAVVVLVYSL